MRTNFPIDVCHWAGNAPSRCVFVIFDLSLAFATGFSSLEKVKCWTSHALSSMWTLNTKHVKCRFYRSIEKPIETNIPNAAHSIQVCIVAVGALSLSLSLWKYDRQDTADIHGMPDFAYVKSFMQNSYLPSHLHSVSGAFELFHSSAA